MTTKTLIPYEATHPGTLIKDELEFRKNLTQKDLATLLGVKPSFLNEIIKGKRPLTVDIALLLEKILEIPADYWMKFQSQYEIDCARIKEKNIAKINFIELWNIISLYVPVKYFDKKGYLTGDLNNNISTIHSIYSVHNIEELVGKFSEKKSAFFKRSAKLQIDEKNMLAWTSLVEYEALKKESNSFNFENLPKLINELREIFYMNQDTLIKLDKTFSHFGVKFIILDKLDKTPIDGYSFWAGNNPVIALTLRHNRIDNLAFTLLHELGHIALHIRLNKESRFLDLIKIDNDENENQANLFAQENLIPTELWNDFLDNFMPISDSNIISFSEKYRINPAIVLGRVCFEMNSYKVKSKIDKKLQ